MPAQRFRSAGRSLTPTRALVLYVFAHCVLGLVVERAPVLGTVHGVVVGGALLLAGLLGRDLTRLVTLTAYAGLCDVFWRMTQTRVPWEASKYFVVFGAACILVRFVPRWHRAGTPLVLLAVLSV